MQSFLSVEYSCRCLPVHPFLDNLVCLRSRAEWSQAGEEEERQTQDNGRISWGYVLRHVGFVIKRHLPQGCHHDFFLRLRCLGRSSREWFGRNVFDGDRALETRKCPALASSTLLASTLDILFVAKDEDHWLAGGKIGNL